MPNNCDDGCQISIPVTIKQIEHGTPPNLSWSAVLVIHYLSDVSIPEAAHNMAAEIVAVGD
jgi:hypothetical protein